MQTFWGFLGIGQGVQEGFWEDLVSPRQLEPRGRRKEAGACPLEDLGERIEAHTRGARVVI